MINLTSVATETSKKISAASLEDTEKVKLITNIIMQNVITCSCSTSVRL